MDRRKGDRRPVARQFDRRQGKPVVSRAVFRWVLAIIVLEAIWIGYCLYA